MPVPIPRHARQKIIAIVFSIVACCGSAIAHPHQFIKRHHGTPDGSNPQVTCLAKVIYFEARNQSGQVQAQVGQVVLNRVKDSSPRFPNTVCDVMRQRLKPRVCQFSWMCSRHSIKDIRAWDKAEDIAKTLYLFYYAIPLIPDWTHGAKYFVKAGTHRVWMKGMGKKRVGDVTFLASVGD